MDFPKAQRVLKDASIDRFVVFWLVICHSLHFGLSILAFFGAFSSMIFWDQTLAAEVSL